MPRVIHVKSARKDYPDVGIKKGDEYFHWTFKTGPRSSMKVKSKTRPRLSQLTLSEFLGTWYALQESIDDGRFRGLDNKDDFEAALEEVKGEIEQLRDEQEDKKMNMPESLQESPTGELLQERYDVLEEVYNELDNVEVDVDEDVIKSEVVDELKEAHVDDLDGSDDFSDKEKEEKMAAYTPPEDEVDEAVKEKVSEKLEEAAQEAEDALSNASV